MLSGITSDLLVTTAQREWSLIGEKLLVAYLGITAEKLLYDAQPITRHNWTMILIPE
jgi:hypothetical protein